MTDKRDSIEIEIQPSPGDSETKCISCGTDFNTKDALDNHYEKNPDHRTLSTTFEVEDTEVTGRLSNGWVEHEGCMREFKNLEQEVTKGQVDVELDREMELIFIEVDKEVIDTLSLEGHNVAGEDPVSWALDGSLLLVEVAVDK